MAVTAKLRSERGLEGGVPCGPTTASCCAFPGNDEPLETDLLLPSPAELKDLVLRQLGSCLNARCQVPRGGRDVRCCLPKRRARRSAPPLWQQRGSAQPILLSCRLTISLLFPILLETYRECIRDIFDLPGNCFDPGRKSAKARFGSPRLNRKSLRRCTPPCCFPTSPTTSTKATLLWRSGVPRLFRHRSVATGGVARRHGPSRVTGSAGDRGSRNPSPDAGRGIPCAS